MYGSSKMYESSSEANEVSKTNDLEDQESVGQIAAQSFIVPKSQKRKRRRIRLVSATR